MRRIFSKSTFCARLALVLAICVSLVAAGCGGDDGESGSASTSPAASTSPSGTTAVEDVAFSGSAENGLPIGYDEPEPAKHRLAFLTIAAANEFMKGVGGAMVAETKRLGGEAVIIDGKFDVNTQVTQFQQAIAQGVEGMLINAADNKALAPVLAQAKAKGIPVIGLDTTQSATDLEGFTSQVWESREEQAFMQVKELAKHLPKGAKVGQITSGLPIPVVRVFSEYESKWAPKFGLEIVGTVEAPGDGIAEGEKAMTGLLAKYPDVEGLLPYNDPVGIGAGAAARTQGKRDFPIVGTNGGTDALEAIKSGRLTATIKIDAVGIGRYAAWGLYNALAGKEIPPTVLSGKPVVVTKENVDQVKSWQQEVEEIGAG